MYIYFDTNGVLKEIINDDKARVGSTNVNRVYVYLEDNPTIDELFWVMQKPDGTLTNEVSIKANQVSTIIPYDKNRDMKYFVDYKTYNFYYYDLQDTDLDVSGLAFATIRAVVDSSIYAKGLITFNIENNIIKSDSEITQSQYDYFLYLLGQKNITSVVVTNTSETTATLTITFASGESFTSAGFTLPKGPKGDKGATGDTGQQGVQGETGNGISEIHLKSSSGLIDTYQITYTDGTTYDYYVTNGASATIDAETLQRYLEGSNSVDVTYDSATSKLIVAINEAYETALRTLIEEKATKTELNTAIGTVESEIGDLQDEDVEINVKINSHDTRLNSVETDLETANTNITNLQTNKQDSLVDSNDITVNDDNTLVIVDTLKNKINNSLQTPTNAPTNTVLVAIDSSKAQQEITIGDGLTLTNNILTAQGSGEEITPQKLQELIEGSNTIVVDLNEAGTKLLVKWDETYKETLENNISSKATITELNTKQDKLTAGDNITISDDNVISANIGVSATLGYEVVQNNVLLNASGETLVDTNGNILEYTEE